MSSSGFFGYRRFPPPFGSCGSEVGRVEAAYPSVELFFSLSGRRTINLTPFNFTKIAVGLYRNTLGAPPAPGVQGDLLRELQHDYPSLTQIPNGVLFTDPARGRALLIDQTHIEVSENSPHVPISALERMQSNVRTIVPIVDYSPPFRIRVEGTGTVQALEGVSPTAVLRAHAPPDPHWDAIAGTCTHACVRYLFTAEQGMQRDVHVEPLFAQQDKFYVMMVSVSGAQGLPTLDAAMRQAQSEVDVIGRLSDRIVADLVEQHLPDARP